MCMYVVGICSPDDQWQKMKAAYEACENAGVDIPESVLAFFDWQVPNIRGMEVKLPLKEWGDQRREGYELAVKDLPPHVMSLLFYDPRS